MTERNNLKQTLWPKHSIFPFMERVMTIEQATHIVIRMLIGSENSENISPIREAITCLGHFQQREKNGGNVNKSIHQEKISQLIYCGKSCIANTMYTAYTSTYQYLLIGLFANIFFIQTRHHFTQHSGVKRSLRTVNSAWPAKEKKKQFISYCSDDVFHTVADTDTTFSINLSHLTFSMEWKCSTVG